MATARPPKGFGKTSSVGIVVYFDGRRVFLADFLGERKIPPTRNVGGIDDDAGPRIQRSGRTDADFVDTRAAFGLLRNSSVDRLNYRSEASFGRGMAIHRRASVRK